MDPQQSSYLLRLARVGTVLLVVMVAATLVMRAQRRGSAAKSSSSPREHEILRVERMDVGVEEADDRDRNDSIPKASSLASPLAQFPQVPERYILNTGPQVPTELRIPPLKVDRSLLPLNQPLQPERTLAPSEQ